MLQFYILQLHHKRKNCIAQLNFTSITLICQRLNRIRRPRDRPNVHMLTSDFSDHREHIKRRYPRQKEVCARQLSLHNRSSFQTRGSEIKRFANFISASRQKEVRMGQKCTTTIWEQLNAVTTIKTKPFKVNLFLPQFIVQSAKQEVLTRQNSLLLQVYIFLLKIKYSHLKATCHFFLKF